MGSYISYFRDTTYRPFAFPAPRASYDDNSLEGLIWINDKIPCVYYKVDSTRPTIIHSHGNACDLGDVNVFMRYLHRNLDVNVLAYEYPGYGLYDQERPSEDTIYNAIHDVYQYLVDNVGVSKSNIILVGQSLGTGPTTWLANVEEAIRAVVLITPFKSACSVVSETAAAVCYSSHIFSMKTLDIFDNYYHLLNIKCPIQIIAGTNDRVTPYSHARELQSISANPLSLITLSGAGHNDVLSPPFLEQILQGIRNVVLC